MLESGKKGEGKADCQAAKLNQNFLGKNKNLFYCEDCEMQGKGRTESERKKKLKKRRGKKLSALGQGCTPVVDGGERNRRDNSTSDLWGNRADGGPEEGKEGRQ